MDATITYRSKEAGQQVSGSTYLNSVDDAGAQAVNTILSGYQVANAWSAINVADAVITGDGSGIDGTKECVATFLCADGSPSTVHIPFVLLTKGSHDVMAAFGVAGDGSASTLTNEAGSGFVRMVRYKEINVRPVALG